MARVKKWRTPPRHATRKVLGKAKGYYGARSKLYKTAKQAVIKAGQYAYRDRRQRKRQFRALWITRINAAARLHGLSYSRLINGSRTWPTSRLIARCLADIAVHDPEGFGAIAEAGESQALAQKAAELVPAGLSLELGVVIACRHLNELVETVLPPRLMQPQTWPRWTRSGFPTWARKAN